MSKKNKTISNPKFNNKVITGFTLIEVIIGATAILGTLGLIYGVSNKIINSNKNDNEIKYLTRTLNDIDNMTVVANSYEGFNKEKLSLIRHGINSSYGIYSINSSLTKISLNYINIPTHACLAIVNNIVKLDKTFAIVNGLTIENNSQTDVSSLACGAKELNDFSIVRTRDVLHSTPAIPNGGIIPTPPPVIIPAPIVSALPNSSENNSPPVRNNVSLPPSNQTVPKGAINIGGKIIYLLQPEDRPLVKPQLENDSNETSIKIQCSGHRIAHEGNTCWYEYQTPSNDGNCAWTKGTGLKGYWRDNYCSQIPI